MKRWSLCLTVLCSAGLPLTAAAFDYGTDSRFLAAETGAPTLPGARGEGNAYDDMASHRSHTDDDDAPPAPSPEQPEAHLAPPRALNARRNAASPVAAPGSGAPPQPHTRSVLSWQSLLPGSIQ